MSVRLRALTPEELAAFIDEDQERYVEERVKSGEDREVATKVAQEQSGTLFPGGKPAEGQLFFRVLDERGTPVGTLWIGPQLVGPPDGYWVFDVRIDEAFRGNGYGRATMELAEFEARHRGAKELGLNVFGHNEVARRLYESMGYVATAIRMKKTL